MRCSGMGNWHSDITIYRIDPERNMSRFYALSVQPNLFGGHSLIRNWGRIGSGGQSRINFFDSAELAMTAGERLLRNKQRRGYWIKDRAVNKLDKHLRDTKPKPSRTASKHPLI